MTDRPRFTYRESVFARPPGYDEADDIAVTAELNAIAARFVEGPKPGVHTELCLAWHPDECICAGGAVFIDDDGRRR